MYQSYHKVTDTEQRSPPLLHQFFFRACLIHLNAMAYWTFDPSAGERAEKAGHRGDGEDHEREFEGVHAPITASPRPSRRGLSGAGLSGSFARWWNGSRRWGLSGAEPS